MGKACFSSEDRDSSSRSHPAVSQPCGASQSINLELLVQNVLSLVSSTGQLPGIRSSLQARHTLLTEWGVRTPQSLQEKVQHS